MPDPGTPGTQRSQLAAFELVATQAVTDIVGVGHIEPTLSQAVRNLHRPNPGDIPAPGAVRTSPGLDQSINVAVELGVTSDRSAYDTAQDVRRMLTRLLIGHGHTPGHINVTVLHLYDSRQTT